MFDSLKNMKPASQEIRGRCRQFIADHAAWCQQVTGDCSDCPYTCPGKPHSWGTPTVYSPYEENAHVTTIETGAGLGPGYEPLPTWSGAPSISPAPPARFWTAGHCPQTTPASAGKCYSHSGFYHNGSGLRVFREQRSDAALRPLRRIASDVALGRLHGTSKCRQSVKHTLPWTCC